jgi:hypothetical protein
MGSFLAENVHLISDGGEVLCLQGEPEAAFLAERGFRVTTVDPERLQFFDIGRKRWDAIISFGAAIARSVRLPLHRACVEGLKEGGVFLLEDQAPHLTKAEVLEELSGLHITVATQKQGVVRLLGRRPV